MSEIGIKQNPELDVEALFNSAKSTTNTEKAETATPVAVNKTPLQQMQERQQNGIVIKNNNDDGAKRGGPVTDERIESATKAINDMDELAEKAALVGITKKPTNDLEMAELIDRLDGLDINELRRANEAATVPSDSTSIIKTEEVIGADISATTIVTDSNSTAIDSSGLFVPKSQVVDGGVTEVAQEEGNTPSDTVNESDTVSVVIEKEAVKDGDKTIVEFTEEEREKLTTSKQIELITVNKININTGKVTRPDENFMKDYTSNVHKAIGTSAVMTFVASRFRATMRGLTFGEYMDLALSSDITDVEILNKKLTVFYNTIMNSSIGPFTSYDDFLRNFAFKDVSLGTYCLYIATNPESLELGLECGVDTCKKKFTTAFNPRNLLVMDVLSPRFLEIMEKSGSLDGKAAMEYHNESSIITKQVIELPNSGIGIEVGLRSCYDMIHIVLPFINVVESLMNEKHPEDTNKVREIITYTTNYISAIYFKDGNGEYTIREDNIENIVEVMYNLPMGDYEIISAIMTQSDEDYAYAFGVQNVTCPSCGNLTKVVRIDIDEEVFRQFQELGSTRIDKKSLPRL